MSRTAADYLFALMGDPNMGVMVGITDKASFAGYLESEHRSDEIEPFWPASLGEIDELQEAIFLVNEDLTLDQVKAELVAAGFEFSQELQDNMD